MKTTNSNIYVCMKRTDDTSHKTENHHMFFYSKASAGWRTTTDVNLWERNNYVCMKHTDDTSYKTGNHHLFFTWKRLQAGEQSQILIYENNKLKHYFYMKHIDTPHRTENYQLFFIFFFCFIHTFFIYTIHFSNSRLPFFKYKFKILWIYYQHFL